MITERHEQVIAVILSVFVFMHLLSWEPHGIAMFKFITTLRQCFSEKWRNVGECWHFSFFIFSRILVHLAYWRIIFFSQSTCKAPKKSVLKIDPPLYSISFCSFSRDYLWTSFEPNRSTEKDILQCVIDAMVWKFVSIVRRGISMEWPRVFCLKCFFL